jgi:integrase
VGIIDRQPSPTLAAFIENRFTPWAQATFEVASPKTWTGRTQIRNITAYPALINRQLDQVTTEHIVDYAAHLQSKGWKISSVNSSLCVLRRVLRLAVEWGVVAASPKIKLLRGSNQRERVVTSEEESKYLAAAGQPMADIATVLIDTGIRPEENSRLRWEAISWSNGRCGTLQVTHGKTAAARRMIPMTLRVSEVLQRRWEAASRPSEGWIWSAPTSSGHIEPSSIRKQHRRAMRVGNVKPFVLYALRHTFLTRLGEAGCDAWTLARIAGHSSITMSSRYVHPSGHAVFSAMDRLQAQLPEAIVERKALPN